jgi:hypothetical protein
MLWRKAATRERDARSRKRAAEARDSLVEIGVVPAQGLRKSLSFNEEVRVILIPCRAEVEASSLWYSAHELAILKARYILSMPIVPRRALHPPQKSTAAQTPLVRGQRAAVLISSEAFYTRSPLSFP